MSKIGIGSVIEFKDINFNKHTGVVYDSKDILVFGSGKFIGNDTVTSVKRLDIKEKEILDLSSLVRKHAEYDAKLGKGRDLVDAKKRIIRDCLYENFGGIRDKTMFTVETVENTIKDYNKLKVGDVRRFVSLSKDGKAKSELGIVIDDFYVYLLDGSLVNMHGVFIGYKNVRLSKEVRDKFKSISEELKYINKISMNNMKLNELCMDLEANIKGLAKSINV